MAMQLPQCRYLLHVQELVMGGYIKVSALNWNGVTPMRYGKRLTKMNSQFIMGEGNRLVFCKINHEMKEVIYFISIAIIIIVNIEIYHYFCNALGPQQPFKIC